MIEVKLINGETIKVETFKELEKFSEGQIEELNCSYNKLTSLEGIENLDLSNLTYFNCCDNQLTSLEGIESLDFSNLTHFYCYNNQLTSLKGIKNLDLSNLTHFNCGGNQLTSLKGIKNLDLSNLTHFYCGGNQLTSLEGLGSLDLSNLTYFNCGSNQLTSLKGIESLDFSNLTYFYCNGNQLTSLEGIENLNLSNLTHFNCSDNQLTSLEGIENLNLSNLTYFNCSRNKLKEFPRFLLNCRNIEQIHLGGNEIEYSVTELNFMNRIRNRGDQRTTFEDTQNVHSSGIQKSVKDSFDYLINKYKLKENIKSDFFLSTKGLTEVSKNIIFDLTHSEVHSLLGITYLQGLYLVLKEIEQFPEETQKEIFKCLNQEILESKGMCFTGCISRLVNCLTGFSDYIKVGLSDSEEISNIIVTLRRNFKETEEELNLKIKDSLKERGYSDEVIQVWII